MTAAPPPDRRAKILAAALDCFLARGYAATSIADIREASGASTGSIYHFFDGKPALALALVQGAVAGWSATSARALAADATPEAAVKASVAGLVTWGLAHPAELRFMDELRTLRSTDPAFADLAATFGDRRDTAGALYARWAADGHVRPLPWPLAHALMLGPAYDYLRLATLEPPGPDAPDILAESAWNAVRAR